MIAPPHKVVKRSWLPVFFGKLFSHGPFQAQTVGPFIFLPGDSFSHIRVYVHELRHVTHFYIGWLVGGAVWLALTPSWWWLLATPFTYTLAYVLAGFYAMVRGSTWYHDNPFERDARRHAGEPVE